MTFLKSFKEAWTEEWSEFLVAIRLPLRFFVSGLGLAMLGGLMFWIDFGVVHIERNSPKSYAAISAFMDTSLLFLACIFMLVGFAIYCFNRIKQDVLFKPHE